MTEIVDTHGHVWGSPEEYEWVAESWPAGTSGLVYPLSAYREECEKIGVDRGVLVATPHHGPGSPYVRDCVADHDDLFGVLTMDHDRPDAGERAAELLDAPGVVGFRFGGGDLGAVPESVWTAITERDAAAYVLPTVEHLPAVVDLLDDHPDLTVVLDHMGARNGPDPDGAAYGRLEAVAEHASAYVKVTSTPSSERFPHEDVHGHLRHLLEWFGSDRLLWGSDYVYRFRSVTPWQTREWLDHVPVLSSRDRRRIEGETALELLE